MNYTHRPVLRLTTSHTKEKYANGMKRKHKARKVQCYSIERPRRTSDYKYPLLRSFSILRNKKNDHVRRCLCAIMDRSLKHGKKPGMPSR